MRIYVRAVLPILGGSLFRLVVEPSHTINMLRDDIEQLTGINPNRQCLRTIRGHIECGGNLLSEFNQTPQPELEENPHHRRCHRRWPLWAECILAADSEGRGLSPSDESP